MLGTVMDDVIEPAAEDFRLPQVLAALADPHRLATVRFVARHGESWCSQVMQEAGLEMSKSTFSHHLRILREAGVLTKRIQGTRGYTRLRKDDLDRRFPGLIDSIVSADTRLPGRIDGRQLDNCLRQGGDAALRVPAAHPAQHGAAAEPPFLAQLRQHIPAEVNVERRSAPLRSSGRR